MCALQDFEFLTKTVIGPKKTSKLKQTCSQIHQNTIQQVTQNDPINAPIQRTNNYEHGEVDRRKNQIPNDSFIHHSCIL